MSLLDASGKTQKEQYLDILALVLYVLAGLGVLITFAVIGIVFFAMMIPILIQPAEAGAPIAVVGLFMGCVAFVAVAISLLSSGLQAWAGWCLQQRKGYTLILVVAALMLLSIPLGTVLGVLIIMLLSDPEVKTLFGIALPQRSDVPVPDQPSA